MNAGLLNIDAGDVNFAVANLGRWMRAEVPLRERRIVLGNLRIAQHRLGLFIDHFARGTMFNTIEIEARDVGVGDELYFAKVEERHVVTEVTPSPSDAGFVRLVFGAWHIDAEPGELFAAVVE